MAIFISLSHTCSNCQSEGDTAVTVVMSSPVLWQHRTPPVSIPLRSLAFCVRGERLQQMAAGVLVLTHCPHWISMSTELLYLCPCVLIKTATLSHLSFRAIPKYMSTQIFIQCLQAGSFLVGFSCSVSHSLTHWMNRAALMHTSWGSIYFQRKGGNHGCFCTGFPGRTIHSAVLTALGKKQNKAMCTSGEAA